MSAATEPDGEARAPRAFLMNAGDGGDPEVVVARQFTNRYGDDRLVIDSPAPWNTPDGVEPFNDIIGGLEWDEHHQTFEDEWRRHREPLEDVWLVDTSAEDDLREAATEAGYEWVDARGEDYSQSPDPERALVDLAAFVEEADWDHERGAHGGDVVVVRYESKQTGETKSKEGMVNSANAEDEPGRTVGISFVRDDGNSNTVRADDGGSTAIFSNGRYPFMGEVESVEVRPGGDR